MMDEKKVVVLVSGCIPPGLVVEELESPVNTRFMRSPIEVDTSALRAGVR
jgi:hypothetical protein